MPKRVTFLARSIAVALVAVAISTVAGAGAANAATTGPWVVQGYNSDDCVVVHNDSKANDAQVELGLCGWDESQWDFINAPSGPYYRIRHRDSGKCMAVKDSSTANSAKVVQTTCFRGYNELWLPVKKASARGVDYYELKNYNSGLCLNVKGNATGEGADLVQYACDAKAHNDWFTWNPQT